MNKLTITSFMILSLMVSCGGGVKSDVAAPAAIEDAQAALSQDAQVQKEDQELKITLNDILFNFNKVTLRNSGKRVLGKLMDIMEKYPDTIVSVTGHSDNIGSRSAKQKISDGRAKTVAHYLMSKGLTPPRVTYKGLSDKEPLLPNTSRANRQKNRRVELRLSIRHQ